MARKKSKPKKLHGFGFGSEADGVVDGSPMGFVGALPAEESQDFDPAGLWSMGVEAPPARVEPLIRTANVGALGAGFALHFLGVKHALTTALAVNLVDIVGRQLSPKYRAAVQLGPWNTGVFQ